jgi:hypothetical protein
MVRQVVLFGSVLALVGASLLFTAAPAYAQPRGDSHAVVQSGGHGAVSAKCFGGYGGYGYGWGGYYGYPSYYYPTCGYYPCGYYSYSYPCGCGYTSSYYYPYSGCCWR